MTPAERELKAHAEAGEIEIDDLDTILALLARVEKLEAALRWIRQHAHTTPQYIQSKVDAALADAERE